MKRPLCFIGFTMLITILVLTATNSQALLLCTIVSGSVAFLISMFNEKTRKSLFLPFISFSIVLAGILLLFSVNSYNNTVSFADKTCTIRALIKQTPQFSKENNRYYCEARIITIDGKKSISNVKLSFKDKPELSADNEILFNGYVYKTGSSIKCIENNYKSDRLYIGCYNIENLRITNNKYKGYYYYTEKLKNRVSNIFLKRLDTKTAGLMISFLTGDKSYLDKEIYDNFSRSGVSHLMAVSGLHLSVWIILLYALFEKVKKKSIAPYFIMIFAVVLIMIISSFSGSVKRAGFMCLLHLFGKILSHKSDSLNNLGFSVVVILILNPYSVFDIGFILSLISTAAIIVFAIPVSEKIIKRLMTLSIYRHIKQLLSPIIKSVMISVFIFIITLPVVSLNFGYISTMSVITNLLFLPFTFILILTAGVLVIVSPISILSAPVSFVASILSRYAIAVTGIIADFRYSTIPVSSNIIIPWLLISGMIVFLIYYKNKTRLMIKSVTVAAVVLSITFSVCTFYKSISSYKLYIIPAEEKIAVMLTMNAKGILIGYHDSYYFEENVLNLAKKNNIDINCMICTKSRKSTDFAKKNNISSVVTDNDMSIDIMNTVSVYTKADKVIIEGNESYFEITDEAYLQYTDEYDIIYRSSTSGIPMDNENINYVNIDKNTNCVIQVFPKGKIHTGGGIIG